MEPRCPRRHDRPHGFACSHGRKGERVVLLTEREGATRAAFSARARGAAELMVPAEVRVVRAVPLLGSGKTDFAAVRRMAEATEVAVEHAV
jgi:acyl-[acyl-carrier-protein]-phospholipid O-acyltransferase / long-chain-fatty-acid--[acyl-carrier-protein] ligase